MPVGSSTTTAKTQSSVPSSMMCVVSFDASGVPMRKRTQTACDQCRRRKTKCNGERRCNTCISVGLECSYGSDVKQTRGPGYIVHLENMIKSLEEHKNTGVAKSEPSSRDAPSREGKERVGSLPAITIPTFDHPAPWSSSSAPIMISKDRRYSMSDNTTPFDSATGFSAPEFIETSSSQSNVTSFVNEIRHCAYGSWGGIEVLRQIRNHLDFVAGIPPEHSLAFRLINSLDQPHPLKTLSARSPPSIFSPTKQSLSYRIGFAFNKSLLFWPFLDRAYIDRVVAQVYSPTAVTDAQIGHDQMALIYGVASLGESFETPFQWNIDTREEGNWTGLNYFQTTRSMVDPADCDRSVIAVQAVMCMAIFLVSHSAITAAHVLITNAATAAIRLGLHRLPDTFTLPTEEMLRRRRTYQSLRALDTYVSHFLGLPACLPAAGLTLERHGLSSRQQNGTICGTMDEEARATDQIFDILASTQQRAYFSGLDLSYGGAHRVPVSIIRECGRRFDAWKLSQHQAAMYNSSEVAILTQLADTNAQMMAFSPFLHYVLRASSSLTRDGYTAGLRCVAAAVKHVSTLETQGDIRVPGDGCFFASFGLVFAATALLLVEIAGAASPVAEQVKMANVVAEKLLQKLSLENRTIYACFESLQPLYKFTNRLM